MSDSGRPHELQHSRPSCPSPTHTWIYEYIYRFIYILYVCVCICMGFLGGAVVKNLPVNAGDAWNVGLIPGSGRYPGRGYDISLQYSCLENSMNRGAWQATVHGDTKSQTWLTPCMHIHMCVCVFIYIHIIHIYMGLPWWLREVVKNPPTMQQMVGSVTGSGRSPGGQNVNLLQYSWKIPWTEEPGGLQSIGILFSNQTTTCTHIHTHTHMDVHECTIFALLINVTKWTLSQMPF